MTRFIIAALLIAGVVGTNLPAQVGQAPAAIGGPHPNLRGELERPLRYRPDGPDFVIENGHEFFNRPLYGGNTAFRADGGDKPEFVLYLPGRGGNLRLGLMAGDTVKWAHDAARIVSRYRPGSLQYEITDPLLGAHGVLLVQVFALHQTDGVILRVEARGVSPPDAGVNGPVELVVAYGGVNGQRGARDGDIGTEAVPISEWFRLKPEFCRDNVITCDANRFTLASPVATMMGVFPAGATLGVGDAREWDDAEALLRTTRSAATAPADDTKLSVLVGRVPLAEAHPCLITVQRVSAEPIAAADLDTYRNVSAERPGVVRTTPTVSLLPAFRDDQLPQVWAEVEAHFAALRQQIAVETPDPFINAAVGALNVAADAVWDEPRHDIMHGAIAWRTQLLGWRGPYALDALGWHERARQHFEYWASRQNTDPIPATLALPEEATNLARNESALHTNGDMSNNHYDMNLVYIDALFRHLLWTGDLEFARRMWPTIARHLAWERRLFRREFGPEKLPLYEAYAAIWASDDLEYNGGGTAHASAYNWWHNTMAARLGRLVGADPVPYQREADAIARGMRQQLWLPETGMFAEYRDYLGLQRAHASAALWSFYHVLDAPGLVDAHEARSMAQYVETRLPRLPVHGPGVPADLPYHVFATTNWMPYSWSINNVVMGENVHTALGLWQAGCPDEAFTLLKSSILASMFMGICPGNVGSMNYLDVYRRESQRDFADGGGVLARAIVEGLFGIRPDALAGELRIAPGFPPDWEHARLARPGYVLSFRRHDGEDTYVLEQTSSHPLHVTFSVDSWSPDAAVRVNGANATFRTRTGGPDSLPRLEIDGGRSRRTEVQLRWRGRPAPRSTVLAIDQIPVAEPTATAPDGEGSVDLIDLSACFNDRVTEIFRPGKYRTPRSPFASLAIPAQGIGGWAGHVQAMAEIDDSGLRRVAGENGGHLVLPSGVRFATPGPGDAPNIVFTSRWDNYPPEVVIPLNGRARAIHLLMAGSTNWMQSQCDNGEVLVTYRDGSTARLALHNPTNWWPIDQDYFIDDYQFRRPGPIPPRVDLKTGAVRLLDPEAFRGQGRVIPGGAATVLALALDPQRELQSLTVRTLANEVVIGLMAATLVRPSSP